MVEVIVRHRGKGWYQLDWQEAGMQRISSSYCFPFTWVTKALIVHAIEE